MGAEKLLGRSDMLFTSSVLFLSPPQKQRT
jgi:DNA segregation ATPase FtsK/SpoIIIE-like protein